LKRKDDRDGERKNDRDAKALAREEQHFFSAAKAYPNLEDQARRFRGLYSRLPFWAVVLVAFIVWANWDVSVTSSVLQRLHNNEAAIDKFMQLNGVSAATCPSPTQSASCDHLNAMRERLGADRINLHGLVGHGLVGWFHPVGLSVRLLGLVEHARDTQRASGAKSAASELSDPSVPERIESLTNDVIGGLNGIVIPAAFGWLGTLAGLMRSITVKMRDSILAPRDLMVARIGSCLGVSAGLAVGLFFSTDLSGNAAKALDGTITISAAGLSFLAGFGAETFFTFLDTVLVRLLPTNQAPGR
jgi:hypothetical protein